MTTSRLLWISHTSARAYIYIIHTHTLTRVRSHRIFTPRDDRQQDEDRITRFMPLVRLLYYCTVYNSRVFHLKNRTGRPLVVTKRIFYDYFFYLPKFTSALSKSSSSSSSVVVVAVAVLSHAPHTQIRQSNARTRNRRKKNI